VAVELSGFQTERSLLAALTAGERRVVDFRIQPAALATRVEQSQRGTGSECRSRTARTGAERQPMATVPRLMEARAA
jgi:hypothetical protein